jgi:hypothetical protein
LTKNNQNSLQYEQIIFIDSTVEDYQTLIDNFTQPTEVVILDSQRDGVVQITNYLSQYESLDAIHIVSHGDAGKLSLGNTELNQNTLSQYADILTGWNKFLDQDADILLYGCNVAADLAGTEFVKNLSEYTNADISASTDLTGSKDLGGDWDIEYTVGDIEAELAFNAEVNQNYKHVLDNIRIFDNGTYFEKFPPDVTLPGSNFPSSPIRIEINEYFNSPNIDLNPPVIFNPSMIDNSDFRVDYTPIDLSFIDSNIPLLDFGQAENQPFSLNFSNGNFSWIENYPDYPYDKPFINSLVFPFDASSLNFNPTNFEFTSVSLNEIAPLVSGSNSITFKFNAGSFDFSSLTSRNLLTFEFTSKVADFYNVKYNNTVRLADNFTFEATAVTFRSDSITFDYKPTTLNFNPGAFAANANLYEYKLSAADFKAGVTLKQFNASDYRALNYAFKGDELFDSQYYLNRNVIPSGMNPFTDYNENGYRVGRNPNALFDVNYYLGNNIDVRNDGVEPLKHFSLFGFRENNNNRDPNPLFDTSYYNKNNSDVVSADVNSLLHYIQFGYKENFDPRDPNPLFDSSYYNLKNPDVVAEGENPLVHYLTHGWKESIPGSKNFNDNRDPNAFFDTSYYFTIHPDVRIASNTSPSANPLQHYIEFGNTGRVAIEDRTTHPLFASENLLEFTTTIDSNSEGFEFAQNEFAKLNYQLTPREDGRILIAQTIWEPGQDPITWLAKKVTYGVAVAGTWVLSEIAAPAAGAAIDVLEFVAESLPYATLSLTPEDIIFSPVVNPIPPFPVDPEPETQIISHPKDLTIDNILNPDGKGNIFYTPLDPVNTISTTSFPLRDEILESILDEPLIFPGEIPIGTYAYPSSDSMPSWRDVYNPREFEYSSSISFGTATMQDSIRENEIRQIVSQSSVVNSKTRDKFRKGYGNIGFADYSIQGQSGTVRSFSGNSDIPGFAPFVPLEDRKLQTYIVDEFNRQVDTEAKILEQIFTEVVNLEQIETGTGNIGTIRLFTAIPVCQSCGQVIQEFTTKTKGRITIEVIELR